MEYKGEVTSIDKFFGYAILDQTKKIHFSILLAQHSLALLPDIGSTVLLKNVHKFERTVVICKTSVCTGKLNTKFEPSPFIDFVRNKNLGGADLIKLDEIIALFETSFTDVNSDTKNKLILNVLEKLVVLTNTKEIKEHQCFTKLISHFNITSINACRSVEILSNKYSKFPSWSFGIQSQVKKNTLLFGYLEVKPTYCILFLKDSEYGIPCIVIKSPMNESFYTIMNAYVLIKDYKIISEIFKEDVPNVEYLLVEFENIFLVKSGVHANALAPSSDTYKFSENISFLLMKKSMTSVNTENKCQCFLQLSIYNRNNKELLKPEIIFLIINAKFAETAIYLFENQKYKLSFNVALKLSKNVELSRLAPCNIYLLMDPEAVFQKLEYLEDHQTYLNVEECKKKIANSGGTLLSFQGVIKMKRLASNNLPSRTYIKSMKYGFGTPGSQVHQLIFSYKENGKEIYMDCYLNNWENILMPFGLIPQIHVAVKNVLPQSGKYLKATALTSFEILSYEPQMDFQTVNLFQNDHIDWGPRFFLGHGNKIPYGVLVWGRVNNIYILSLDIFRSCKRCNKKTKISTACSQCEDTEQEVNFLLKMHASDEYNQCKVLVKDTEFLKYVLNIPDRQFKNWKEAFEQMGEYNFNTFEKSQLNASATNENDCLKNVVTESLIQFNNAAIINMDLKCRKLDSDPKRNGGRSLWWYIDARRC